MAQPNETYDTSEIKKKYCLQRFPFQTVNRLIYLKNDESFLRMNSPDK